MLKINELRKMSTVTLLEILDGCYMAWFKRQTKTNLKDIELVKRVILEKSGDNNDSKRSNC